MKPLPTQFDDARTGPVLDEPRVHGISGGRFIAELDGISSGPCGCPNEALAAYDAALQVELLRRESVELHAELGFDDDDFPF